MEVMMMKKCQKHTICSKWEYLISWYALSMREKGITRAQIIEQ